MKKPPLTLVLATLVVVSAALLLPSNADQVSCLSAVAISMGTSSHISLHKAMLHACFPHKVPDSVVFNIVMTWAVSHEVHGSGGLGCKSGFGHIMPFKSVLHIMTRAALLMMLREQL